MKTPLNGTRGIAVICAACALVTSGMVAWMALRAVDGRTSGLVRMPDGEPIAGYARAVDPSFHFTPFDGRYDGRYFWTIAADPFARGEAHELIDQNAYRYGHAGYGWLAGALSFGHEPFIPHALLFINLVAMAGGAIALSTYAAHIGVTPWVGLAVAFNPGLLYAVSVDTSEPLGLLLILLTLLAWRAEKWGYAAIAILATCLTKEPYVLVPIGLGIYELIRWKQRGRPTEMWTRFMALAGGPIALALWYSYITRRFGVWPLDQTDENLLFPPLRGTIDTLRIASESSLEQFDRAQIGGAQLPIIAATAALILAACFTALRRLKEVSLPYVLLALVFLSLSSNAILFPKDLIRNLALVLALAPLVAFRAGEALPNLVPERDA